MTPINSDQVSRKLLATILAILVALSAVRPSIVLAEGDVPESTPELQDSGAEVGGESDTAVNSITDQTTEVMPPSDASTANLSEVAASGDASGVDGLPSNTFAESPKSDPPLVDTDSETEVDALPLDSTSEATSDAELTCSDDSVDTQQVDCSPSTESIAEVVAALAEAGVVLQDENGIPLPLASQEAELILTLPDPQFCPTGVPFGGIGCSPSRTTITEALSDAGAAGVAGTIYVQGGTYNENVIFGLWSDDLTIIGGVDGSPSTINGYINVFDSSADITISSFNVDAVYASGNQGTFTLSNITTASGDNGPGVSIGQTGDVILTNINSSNRIEGNGAEVFATGDVTVNGNNTFNNNTPFGFGPISGNGLYVDTPGGDVNISGVTANNNDAFFMGGIVVFSGSGDVSISNSSVSGNNNGISIISTGDIAITNVTANNNSIGLATGTSAGVGAQTVSIVSSSFNDNSAFGIDILDSDVTIIRNTTANGNGLDGFRMHNTEGDNDVVTITSSTFSNNDNFGVNADVGNGSVTLSCVTANNNSNGAFSFAPGATATEFGCGGNLVSVKQVPVQALPPCGGYEVKQPGEGFSKDSDKPILILLMGWTSSSSNFDNWNDFLTPDIKKNYRGVVYFSYSDNPNKYDPSDTFGDFFSDYVPKLNGLIDNCTANGYTKFDIVGHSLGGVVAMHYVSLYGLNKHPGLIRNVITLDSPIHGFSGYKQTVKRLLESCVVDELVLRLLGGPLGGLVGKIQCPIANRIFSEQEALLLLATIGEDRDDWAFLNAQVVDKLKERGTGILNITNTCDQVVSEKDALIDGATQVRLELGCDTDLSGHGNVFGKEPDVEKAILEFLNK